MNNQYFETIKSFDGVIYNIAYHQKRYESVLKFFGINDFLTLKEHLNPPKKGLYRCRLVYDLQNPHAADVTYYEYQKRDVKHLKLVYDNEIKYEHKSTNRDRINELFGQKSECDDILIVKNSLITDTSIANIAFEDSGMWVTPKTPLLKGTTRARLLDAGKIVEKDIKVEDIFSFGKIALLNSMIDFDIILSENIRDVIC